MNQCALAFVSCSYFCTPWWGGGGGGGGMASSYISFVSEYLIYLLNMRCIKTCCFLQFCCILILAFFLELAAAVTLFHKQEHIKHYVESSMYDTIRNRYSSETAFKDAFDTVQEKVRFIVDWNGFLDQISLSRKNFKLKLAWTNSLLEFLRCIIYSN